jgi:RimJ/RimL family protein N-acetyltransferase
MVDVDLIGMRSVAAPTVTDGFVTLDALRPEDAPAMVRAADDGAHTSGGSDEAAGSASFPEERLSLDAALAVVAQAAEGWQSGAHYWLAIRPAMSGEYGGRLDLWPASGGDRGNVGIVVVPQLRRQGLAHRAVELVLPFAFEVLGWTSLVAEMRAENEGAIRLAERIGFERVTDSHPHEDGVEVYAIEAG